MTAKNRKTSDATTMRPTTRASASPRVNFICGTVDPDVGLDEGRTAQAHLLGVTRAADDPLIPQGAPKDAPQGTRRRSRGCLDNRSTGVFVNACQLLCEFEPSIHAGAQLNRPRCRMAHGAGAARAGSHRPFRSGRVRRRARGKTEKFEVFASLNPSLQRAYDEACRPWSKSA